MNIGFVGLGVMGNSMAANLIRAGFELEVYTRTKAKAESILNLGAKWNSTLEEFANCNVVITMLGYPKDVEEVYLGGGGLVECLQPGTALIDMTTSSPALAKKIQSKALEKDIQVLDAPVSGGDVGAKNGTLSIMVGGDKNVFDKVQKVLDPMGNSIYQGPAGSGQYTKLCNQISVAAGMLGVCESLAFAEKSGLDPNTVLKSIQSGAAGSWALTNLAPRILKGDFAPGFFVKHFVKDLKIALDSAEEMNLSLPGLKLAKELYEKLLDNGGGEFGTQALFKLYGTDK